MGLCGENIGLLTPIDRTRTQEGERDMGISIILVVLPLVGAAVGIDAQSRRAARRYRALAARMSQG